MRFNHVKINATGKIEWLETPEQVDSIIQRIPQILDDIGLDFYGHIGKAMAK